MNAPTPNLRDAALDIINRDEWALDKLQAMSEAWDEMFAAAGKFDGSYEAARDRFQEVARS